MASNTSTGDKLLFTFFAAAALHALLILNLGFSIPLADKIAPTLNITLATQISQDAPDKADFLAQHNQQASGESDQAKELRTTERSEFNDSLTQDITPPPQERSTKAAQQTQENLRTQADSQFKLQEHTKTEQDPEQETKEAQEQDIPQTTPEMAALQAKLSQQRQSQALKPKVKRIQAEATKASADATYLHEWNTRVERVGNQNFPQEALTQKLFGTLMMVVTLNANGSVDDVEIIQPSEHPILNQSALQMVYLAGPFEPIPAEVLDGHDKLEITRHWAFEITGVSSTSR